ncbi:MAG: hypothetical protein QXM31_03350 [Candidatus Woesearchaeota archaeon]
MENSVVYGTRRKKQWILSPGPDFDLHKANTIINRLVSKVLKIEAGAKVDYKFFRGEPRIRKVSVEHDCFRLTVVYYPPYGLAHGYIDAVPAAEISASLVFNPEKQCDAEKRKTLSDIVSCL